MTDLAMLKERIDKSRITLTELSDAIGVSRATLYNHLSGKGEFKANEIYKLGKILDLSVLEREQIFFAD